MEISLKAWIKYIDQLRRVNDKAAELVRKYLEKNSIPQTSEEVDALTKYAYKVSTTMGEASSAAAAQMYDRVARAAKVSVPAAEPAPTPTYGEVAKTVNGMLKHNQGSDAIGASIGRLVKRTGVDTTMQNALRDGAEFAWVPQGDTCSFCIMLASNGWQRASKKLIKGGHAEHIHSNCDCTFAIRFDGKSGVEGYDPQVYKDMYDSAPGDSWKDKLNYMDKEYYDLTKDERNERKRALYDRNRRLNYGEKSDIEVDKGIVHSRKVDKYGYNNIFVDENVSLTERQLRNINGQVSEAKQVLGISDYCDATVLVTDLGDRLATYNPRTNILQINKTMSSDDNIRLLQKMFACPGDTRSTMIHEMFHWKDADEYRKTIGEIRDASIASEYSVFQRDRALSELKKLGIDIDSLDALNQISYYAKKQALENNWEEVYTEYRTKLLLEGGI